MVEPVTVKFDADEAVEMMGLALAQKANKMMEEGRDDEMVQKLHTIGREMTEEARGQKELKPAEEDPDPEFSDSLYDV